MRTGHLRHVEMQQGTFHLFRHLFGEIGLARPWGTCQQENTHGLAANLKRQTTAHLLGNILADLILSDHARAAKRPVHRRRGRFRGVRGP